MAAARSTKVTAGPFPITRSLVFQTPEAQRVSLSFVEMKRWHFEKANLGR